ncbi:hypothetical protein D9M69_694780 [compost metagenome]
MVPLVHFPIRAEQLLRPLATTGDQELEQLRGRERQLFGQQMPECAQLVLAERSFSGLFPIFLHRDAGHRVADQAKAILLFEVGARVVVLLQGALEG